MEWKETLYNKPAHRASVTSLVIARCGHDSSKTAWHVHMRWSKGSAMPAFSGDNGATQKAALGPSQAHHGAQWPCNPLAWGLPERCLGEVMGSSWEGRR